MNGEADPVLEAYESDNAELAARTLGAPVCFAGPQLNRSSCMDAILPPQALQAGWEQASTSS